MDNHPETGNVIIYECQFCQNRFQEFIPWPDKFDFPQVEYEMWNKHTAICPSCYSMDRERMYRLYIEKETDLLTGPKSVFHTSSEVRMRDWLINQPTIYYVRGYLTSENCMRQEKAITTIDFPDETFDVVVCSHVLEHVPEDLKAMKELHRVLKNDGWGIMQVPIALNLQKTYEDPTIVSPEDRYRAFGQDDHVRIYAKEDYVQRLESVGFTVKQVHLAQTYGMTNIMKYGLSPKDILYIVSKNIVSHGSDVTGTFVSNGKRDSSQSMHTSWFNKILRKICRRR